MNVKQIERLVKEQVHYIQSVCPVDTGNLRASIRYRQVDKLVWEIYVNAGDDPYAKYKRGIAPYMPFTNEKWEDPRWNNKQNPNEGWWNRACQNVIENLKRDLKGQLTLRKGGNKRANK